MSGWKDDDEVTTTYGSIQLSLEQAHAAGIKTERERIIKLLEIECEVSCDECWDEGVKNVITRLRADSNE